jgi:hypothetical protein
VIALTRWVVYRDICGTDLVIFADVDTAVHEDAIYSALRESDTWGEFRRRLPAGEWPAIAQQLAWEDDDLEEDEARSQWQDDNAPFVRKLVQGVEDSYPPVRSRWLGNPEDFPNVLIKAHNEVLAFSPYHPVHWQIPAACAEAVAAMLREGGYLVERADFLEFC